MFSRRHREDALVSEGLDLLRQQLAVLIAVAQLASDRGVEKKILLIRRLRTTACRSPTDPSLVLTPPFLSQNAASAEPPPPTHPPR